MMINDNNILSLKVTIAVCSDMIEIFNGSVIIIYT